MSWSKKLPGPIKLRDDRELATLSDARSLILDLTESRQARPTWLYATESILRAAETGKRADLAVVSLAGSPYLPWEDPAAAVVFGGSPDRIVATLVDGQTRYDRERFEWQEVRSTSASARERMLRA